MLDLLKKSNRYKHLLGGLALGAISDDIYCATIVGLTAASCLELKDKLWGGKWDWIDWGFTVVGAALGFLTKLLIKSLI